MARNHARTTPKERNAVLLNARSRLRPVTTKLIARPRVEQHHPQRVNHPDAGRRLVDLARPARPVATVARGRG
jgi:hypothetical protein